MTLGAYQPEWVENHTISLPSVSLVEMENVMNKFFVTQVSNEVFVVVLAALLSLVIIHLLIASSIPAILSGITGLYVIRRELLTT